ncbi:MAG: DNA repair protein RecN [Anaerolineae bacterium]|jgi:DNA repair protein RecN (Recombination protein N)|nr:DNA repair protein RecN [Chloroflexota bacterium]
MLLELAISNLAIIEQARIAFSSGLTVLTGETGAGKSIIVDAVSLLLGSRASAEVVRTGADAATVEGIFGIEPATEAALSGLIQEIGVEPEDGMLILRREVFRSRRSVCRVNGRAVPLATMESIGHHLIDIHGQGEHLALLRPRTHIDYLDRYGGLIETRQALAEVVGRYREASREVAGLVSDRREMARRVDLLTYQIDEIKRASLTPGEDEELARQRELLVTAEQRAQLAASVYEQLVGGDDVRRAALDLVGRASEQLDALARIDPTLQADREALDAAYYQLEEVGRTVRAYRDDVDFDPAALAEVEDRQNLIRNLQRKYGDTLEEVLAFGERAEQELNGITHSEERLEELAVLQQRLLEQIRDCAQALSEKRQQVARNLSQEVERELDELNMAQARFIVSLQREPAPADAQWEGVPCQDGRWRFDATGIDRVEFLIAPNPGEEPQPLVRIASGGETSRLMLALKSVLSVADAVPTLIFDEIDAGIGGRTGEVVGNKLWRLSREHQVFCVTHLAQLARYADLHIQVAKEVLDERTFSVARPLSHEERVTELAIMLGGAATESHRRSAQELLDTAGAQRSDGSSSR